MLRSKRKVQDKKIGIVRCRNFIGNQEQSKKVPSVLGWQDVKGGQSQIDHHLELVVTPDHHFELVVIPDQLVNSCEKIIGLDSD